jgi:hypothetical protein
VYLNQTEVLKLFYKALLNKEMNRCVSIVGVGAVREPPLQAFIPQISNAFYKKWLNKKIKKWDSFRTNPTTVPLRGEH